MKNALISLKMSITKQISDCSLFIYLLNMQQAEQKHRELIAGRAETWQAEQKHRDLILSYQHPLPLYNKD